ncbi:DUF5916 domain-containing protein [Corallococcus terminator]
MLGWVALTARAQEGAPLDSRHLQAQQVEKGPVLDGVLDDEVWKRAVFTSDFLQKEPEQGLPASLKTEVAFVYDADALYVGARMSSMSLDDIETVMTRRDESGSAERLIISLDTYRDRRTAYSFAVTAAGVRVDWYHPDDHEYVRDLSFNPVWEARTTQTSDGWVAELRIPFSQLRFDAANEQVWGLNINRVIPRRNEEDFWVVVPRDITGWSSRFGELSGLRGVAPSHRIELLPYVAGDLRADAGENPRAGTPFENRRPYSARVGLDGKVGLGPNLNLDVTVNPDFGQIDADPAQVNLTDFEAIFDERRPFFTEGRQLFNNNNTNNAGPAYFYSRRIGAAPRLGASAAYVEPLKASTIWGAAKLTGRLSSGLSLGVLGAVTGDGYADTYDYDTREQARVKLDSRTGYSVLRAQQELSKGSTVGATLTTLHRDIGEGEGRTRELTREAYTGGADFRLRLLGGEYIVSGFAGGSLVRGEPEALLRLQRSSARYFQRPDQTYVHLDPEARSMSGYAVGAKVLRQSGEHWLWNGSVGVESPGFELNDLGRLSTTDDLDVNLGLTYRETNPGSLLRAYSLSLLGYGNWNHGGVRTVNQFVLSSEVTFLNFWEASLSLTYLPRAFSDALTRGGPLMQTPQGWEANLLLNNNVSSTQLWSLDALGWTYEDGSRGVTVTGAVTVQPLRNLRLSLEPVGSLYTEARQYMATLEDGREETYGRRYVFGTVRRRELALRLRANLFLTPDLSLEAYAEPFASSGVYSAPGELARARGRLLRGYGEDGTTLVRGDDGGWDVTDGARSFYLDNQNFNVRSFRSNVVLRWEWHPGSTLFAVWQQDRSASALLGNALAPRALGDALLSSGGHTFALKLTWWFPAG